MKTTWKNNGGLFCLESFLSTYINILFLVYMEAHKATESELHLTKTSIIFKNKQTYTKQNMKKCFNYKQIIFPTRSVKYTMAIQNCKSIHLRFQTYYLLY